ncbi:hypothetical protein Xcel_1109 [Xylanimonas cellulosilytica DSM 15894]|uniref:DUF1648 domain-containing protein n=1 Tax=Xylanimonas cellulosilytica (strain DSM 15894 / JCM 12276 / CECT 5975 / KCTC 9989 / LMG 20990 / NBRC 107835 / XIL07) TaxID=446471 RepID=D1BZI6_XYLCX|nr:hypothetical protein [Xylanimonas cellulosilytica]ACZ30140.1 hypothetical protein Xcel_1109 [Xylanimonas cellulosilytica DSM 15894]
MTTSPDPGVRTSEPWKALARRSTLWSAAVALLLLIASTALVLSWRGDLPDPIASHWGSGVEPDGFMSLTQWVVTMAATGVGTIAIFSAIGLFWGRAAATRRIAAAATVWIGAFLAVVQVTAIAGQRGLADAAAARGSGGWLVASYLLPLLPAVAAAFLVPGDPRQAATGPVPADAARTGLADGEHAVWVRRIGGGTGLWIGAATIALMLAVALFTRTWELLVVPALLAVLFAAMMVFEVRVDAAGLTVRSALGWPRTFVPADEVVRADPVQVSAFRQFGGWGWRVAPGGNVGVVPRSGEGLEVVRTGGRSLTITVDDAATAAALLNTMADRTR